ncbi:MAG: hypothetical protein JWL81_986 [Verrucomicrobiales bacterium]|nr:hypothetical protein [Verrucomicrobiales bacterium]
MNLLLVAAALLLLVVPLVRLERGGLMAAPTGGAVTGQGKKAADVPVLVLLKFVHAPAKVSVSVEGKPLVLRGEGLERQAETVLSDSGRELELAVTAEWPAGVDRSMVEVRAAPDGLAEQSQNVWAEGGPVDEIARFSWRARP